MQSIEGTSIGQDTGGLKTKLGRPNRTVSSSRLNKAEPTTSWFFYLPKELWLNILVNYGVSSMDLVSLDRSCKWFSTCWEGNVHLYASRKVTMLKSCSGDSITEEAARLIIKRHKRKRFGELTNRGNQQR